MPTKLIGLFFFTLLFSTATTVSADVIDSSAAGFTSRSTVQINASPKAVFKHLVSDIGRWWDPDHTYSGGSLNLYIEPRAGGCFCEKLKAQGSVQHMTVVYVVPDETLRMVGALGPLQQFAAAGALTISLKANAGGTSVTWNYAVGGHHPKGFQGFAAPVDAVLKTQLERFKKYAETGKP